MNELLQLRNIKKYFTKKSIFSNKVSVVKAVDNISIGIKEGETFVLAGESGSGKSTIAKIIFHSVIPDSGEIFFKGEKITFDSNSINKIRLGCQMVHQDPYDSINPRMRIIDIVGEPLEIHNIGTKDERRKKIIESLREVKLEPAEDIINKYPHMLSGGQRQRVVLARALVTKPEVIIADEPVSMLDVSIKAEMLEIMSDLQKKRGISFIYITHDLATARYFGHRIGILYQGKIVEEGPITEVLFKPRHPYTQALIDAISEPDPNNLKQEKKIRISEGQPHISGGCRFMSRCPYVIERCNSEPQLESIEKERKLACHVDIRE